MSEVLVIAPHPDDETLGCGGTILKHRAQGDRVHWLIVTSMQEEFGWDGEAVKRRKGEISTVSGLYGFEGVHELGYPTIRLDTVPMSELTSSVSSVIAKVKPATVYVPFGGDIHTDHQIVFRAALGSTKSFRAPSVKRILAYECLSETDFAPPVRGKIFAPSVFVDISGFFARKMEIMRVYSSELMEGNLPRSAAAIEALARLRGARIGREYAEAFVLLEEIA